MKRSVTPSEYQEQAAVIEWWSHAHKLYGVPEFALYSVPNGAVLAGDHRRRAIQMNNLKRTGLRKGMLDLNLDLPLYRVHTDGALLVVPGLRIEMKVGANKPTAEQDAVINWLLKNHYAVRVCYTSEDAIEAIRDYLRNYSRSLPDDKGDFDPRSDDKHNDPRRGLARELNRRIR